MTADDNLSRTGLPSIDRVLPTLRLVGTSGFVVVSNYGLRGPEYFHSEYPVEWQREYERGTLFLVDPVLQWAIFRTGTKRWSEVASSESEVMRRARRFGLNYGVVMSRGGSVGPIALPGADKKTVVTVARADRECSDEELALLSSLMDGLVRDLPRDRALTIQETDVLRALRDGGSHKEIADQLGIGISTVRLRISTAQKKLGAKSAVSAVALAMQRNLI